VANRIQEQSAFKWWVSDTLRTRNRIIENVKSRYWKTSHKYGVRLPHSVQEALPINKETGTDFWWQAIQKDLKKAMVAFEYNKGIPEQLRQDKTVYVGFHEIACPVIFGGKVDLTRKACFVAGGHMTEPLASITYSSVLSRDSGAGIANNHEDMQDITAMNRMISLRTNNQKHKLGIRNGLLVSFRKGKEDLYHVWELQQMRTAVPGRWKGKQVHILIPPRKQLARRPSTPY
jgi:hypothetical protein